MNGKKENKMRYVIKKNYTIEDLESDSYISLWYDEEDECIHMDVDGGEGEGDFVLDMEEAEKLAFVLSEICEENI